MILIVGGSGRLGGAVARRLLAEGKAVRAMSRTPSKLNALATLGAEVISGDLRDPGSLARACQGVDMVLAAAHAFDSAGRNVPGAVDDAGNRHLIDAARAAGVQHFVLTSIHGARADHPVDMFRCKYRAEQYLRTSGLSYTILRPTAYMELWVEAILGKPIIRGGRAPIFGHGTNPINFVSVRDVARFAVIALEDARAREQVIEIGGPENLTLMQVVETIERVTGRTANTVRIPLMMMRVMAVVARLINPAFSEKNLSSIEMDTQDMTFDPTPTLTRFPMELTRLEDVVRAWYSSQHGD